MTETSLVPEPIDWDVVVLYDDSVLLVPHSNQDVVAAPLGFTEPFSVADVANTAEAADVVTVAKTAAVVKLKMLPLCIPTPFCPATR